MPGYVRARWAPKNSMSRSCASQLVRTHVHGMRVRGISPQRRSRDDIDAAQQHRKRQARRHGRWRGLLITLKRREPDILSPKTLAGLAQAAQFEGLFPMAVWFETGITQSMAWTLLAPYLDECPEENHRIKWRNFPALTIVVSLILLPPDLNLTRCNSEQPQRDRLQL